METCELFLLLPKYQESQDDQSPYLCSFELKEPDDIQSFLRIIEDINDFFTHENYQNYYDSDNVKAFAYPLNELEDCYPDQTTYLRSLLRSWENWRESSLQEEEDSFCFSDLPISNDTLCEIAKRKTTNSQNTYLLVNHSALNHTKAIIVICNKNKIQIDQCGGSIKHISQWFETNRKPTRTFHLNPKHGENGIGAYHKNKGEEVSILLCSKQEAEIMLQKALGTFNAPTLYYYDEVNQKYIEYKFENTPNNSYHAFHIDKERVPKDVIAKIKKVVGIK